VFIPLLLMGGLIGRLFREFAVTVSVAILMSGLVSLTLTPMMCGQLLPRSQGHERGRFARTLETGFEAAHGFYDRTLRVALRHRLLVLGIMLATMAATVYLYVLVPKGFFPQQDNGLITGSTEAAQDISYPAMVERQRALARIVMADPDVGTVYYWVGSNPSVNSGRLMIDLKPFAERRASAQQVIARLRREAAKVPGIALFLTARQDVQIGAKVSKTQYQYTLEGPNVAELIQWAPIILGKLQALPQLQDATGDLQATAPRMLLKIDRDALGRLGINPQAVDDTLYDAFGQRQVATIFTQLDQHHVILEIEPRYQEDPESLDRLYIRSATNGQLVPLSALTRFDNSVTPLTVNHQDQFPAVTLSFNLAPGHSLGEALTAIQAMERTVAKPATLTTRYQGSAKVFESSLATQPYLIAAAIIAVYIVLGVLYESFIHPLTILSTLPSAGVGALLALIGLGYEFSLIALIGVILLVGIVKKNAIMMIDFALEGERKRGLPPEQAIYEACLLRFRPIMMTTMAALLGGLPLALGAGAGSELRRPLGIAIVGGLLLSQLLTLYTTPVVYLYMARIPGLLRSLFGRRPVAAAAPTGAQRGPAE
jgi:multidrug efflux pump